MHAPPFHFVQEVSARGFIDHRDPTAERHVQERTAVLMRRQQHARGQTASTSFIAPPDRREHDYDMTTGDTRRHASGEKKESQGHVYILMCMPLMSTHQASALPAGALRALVRPLYASRDEACLMAVRDAMNTHLYARRVYQTLPEDKKRHIHDKARQLASTYAPAPHKLERCVDLVVATGLYNRTPATNLQAAIRALHGGAWVVSVPVWDGASVMEHPKGSAPTTLSVLMEQPVDPMKHAAEAVAAEARPPIDDIVPFQAFLEPSQVRDAARRLAVQNLEAVVEWAWDHVFTAVQRADLDAKADASVRGRRAHNKKTEGKTKEEAAQQTLAFMHEAHEEKIRIGAAALQCQCSVPLDALLHKLGGGLYLHRGVRVISDVTQAHMQ